METGLASSRIHLVDTTYSPEQASGCHLALQVCLHSTAFVVVEEERNVVLAAGMWPSASEHDMAQAFQVLIQDDLFTQSSFESVSLSVDGTPQTLVPQALFSDASTHLGFSYGKDFTHAAHQAVDGMGAVMCYNLPEALKQAFHTAFPQGHIYNSAALFIQSLLRKNRFARGQQLFVEVCQGYAQYYLMEGSQLMLHNHFHTENEFDVLYHALNICQQHNADQNQVQVRIHGHVDSKHATVALIKEHFGKVEINFGLDFQRMALGLSRVRKQHFASLFNQYVCVS